MEDPPVPPQQLEKFDESIFQDLTIIANTSFTNINVKTKKKKGKNPEVPIRLEVDPLYYLPGQVPKSPKNL